MKVIHLLGSITLLGIGVVHIVVSFSIYDTLSLDQLWFIGAGLAMIFVAFINVIFRPLPERKWVYLITQSSNGLMLSFVCAVNFVTPMIPGWIGLIACLALIFTSFRIHAVSRIR